jgi:hypothetical protein
MAETFACSVQIVKIFGVAALAEFGRNMLVRKKVKTRKTVLFFIVNTCSTFFPGGISATRVE